MIKIAEGIIVEIEFEEVIGGAVVTDEVLIYINSLHYQRCVVIDG